MGELELPSRLDGLHAWALLALVSLFCFRSSLDRWANGYLVSSAEDGMKAALRTKAIAKLNQEGRAVWAGAIWVAVSAFRTDQPEMVYDPVLLALVFVVAPLTLLTWSPESHARFGWINQVAQHVWLVTRLVGPGARIEEQKVAMFVAGALIWNELSISSFGMLLFNHALTNLIVLSFLSLVAPTSLLLSVLMISFFCYRRSRPLEDADELPQNLSGLTIKCAELVRVVLESGDELCQANVEALEQMLGLLTGKETTEKTSKEPPKPGSMTESSSGQGGGTGFDVQRTQSGHSMADWNVAALPNGEAHTESSVFDDFLSTPLDSDEWILDSCFGATDTQPEIFPDSLDAKPEPSALNEFQKRPRDEAPAAKPEESPTLPHAEQLVRMSFDAMAQVDVSTGMILWANTAFGELTRIVGGGNPVLGAQCLHGRFLGQVSLQSRLLHDTFGTGGNAVEVWSASQLAGDAPQTVALWVLHSSDASIPAASSMYNSPQYNTHNTSPSPSPSLAQSPAASEHDHGSEDSAGYPAASRYTNTTTRVLYGAGSGACVQPGRGVRQAVLLWRRYGKKNITSLKPPQHGIPGTIERIYYKCYHAGCAARLRVDMDPVTGQSVSVDPSGVHNHVVTTL
eukprot:TRINITY_DN542_c0_g4_i1.p1 TRINITY_DN542_c0_g4~~TRINITY_DN542_c0_g4_i1.p1  ORF type:complete len:627 (+),score=107.01 TRINITY_DN542_c0_g4_i1:184-2064(+)